MDDDIKKLTVELIGLKERMEMTAHNTAKTSEKLDAIEKTLEAILAAIKK